DAPQCGEPKPCLIVVATEGGGLRAAYWTGAVLGLLADRSSVFKDQAFAISGVSGGALGAVLYATALREDPPPQNNLNQCTDQNNTNNPLNSRRIECRIELALAQDFLGPAVGGMLFTDLWNQFLPLPHGLPDRAVTLEQGWETGWASARDGALD